MDDNRIQPIVIEQVFNVSAEIIWNALTHLKEMTSWYFENIPNFKAEIGFKAPPFVVSSGERTFTHI